MKRFLPVVVGSFLIILVTQFSGYRTELQANAAPDAVGEIILVAGDVIDLEWYPSLYPGTGTLIKWELNRRIDGGTNQVIASGTDTYQDYFRDERLNDNTKYYYSLEVTRCPDPCSGPDDYVKLTAFSVEATTGELWGTVKKDLTLSDGEFLVKGIVIIPERNKLVIEDGTTLKGYTRDTCIRADGGTLSIIGGTFKENIKIQYGVPDNTTSMGTGGVSGATFGVTTPPSDTAVQIYGKSRIFSVVKNTRIRVEVLHGNRVVMQGNTGSMLFLYDQATADVQENEMSVYLNDQASALVKNNPLITVNAGDEATITIEDNKDGSVWLTGKSSAEIKNNSLSWVNVAGQSNAIIKNNPALKLVDVEESATALLEKNTISPSGIQVSGYGAPVDQKASAVIVGNTITSTILHEGVDVSYGSNITLIGNDIKWTGYHEGDESHESESSVLVSVSGKETSLTAHRNVITNGKIGVFWGSAITVTENIITEPGAAITIGCVFCGTDVQATGRIEQNTLQNGWGFEMYAGSQELIIKHNCIRSNDPGLTIEDIYLEKVLDFEYNWWGHKDGPTHPTNPIGKGDAIIGSKVDFDPWDKTDQYCLDTAPPPYPDLSFAGMEAVQVVQDLANSVPLVAGKPTMLRVYPESSLGTISNVPYELKAVRGGTTLGTLSGTTNVSPIVDIQQVRANQNQGLSFKLDDSWLSGTVDISIELKRMNGITETTYTNNVAKIKLDFVDRRSLRVAYLPIRYKPPSESAENLPETSNLGEVNAYLKNLFPNSDVTYKIFSPLLWDLQMKGAITDTEKTNGDLLINILNNWLQIWNSNHTPDYYFDQIVGVFPGSSNYFISYGTSDPRWEKTGDRAGLGLASYVWLNHVDIAHEIGHNLGLRHANTPDALLEAPEDNYWDDIYRDATIQEFGYDFRIPEGNLVPKSRFDLMSYVVGERWLSPLHYTMLFNADATPQYQMLNVDEEQVFLMVSGIVTQDGSVTFQPFWQLSSDTEPPNPNEGTDYCIEMRDINDLILESKCFSLSFYNYEGFTESNSDHFLVFLPFDINTTNIALRHGDQILGSVNVSEHQPTVTIIEPNGGEVLEGQTVVRWSAEDEDDNDLSFNILYSQDDGISWQPVAINLTDVFSYTLDLSLIPGGAASRMKVEVSDGYYTADDPSDNSFYVENNIPLVTIAGPEDGSTVVSPINLRGYAYDPEDGELDRGNLKWSSDIDGDLGSGETVTSVSLTEGEHLITLEAQDSQSKTNSTSILITVVPGVNLYLPQVMR